MGGVLAGILLSRTVSGTVGAVIGWRPVFVAAAVVMALLGVALRVMVPASPATTTLAYRRADRVAVVDPEARARLAAAHDRRRARVRRVHDVLVDDRLSPDAQLDRWRQSARRHAWHPRPHRHRASHRSSAGWRCGSRPHGSMSSALLVIATAFGSVLARRRVARRDLRRRRAARCGRPGESPDEPDGDFRARARGAQSGSMRSTWWATSSAVRSARRSLHRHGSAAAGRSCARSVSLARCSPCPRCVDHRISP